MTSLLAVPTCQRPCADADWFPALDVTETDRDYVVEVDLPGLKPEEVEFRVESDALCIRGRRLHPPSCGKRLRVERTSGAFVRRLPLPPGTQGEIQATFADGVLELRVFKAPSEAADAPASAQAVPSEPLPAGS